MICGYNFFHFMSPGSSKDVVWGWIVYEAEQQEHSDGPVAIGKTISLSDTVYDPLNIVNTCLGV